MLKKERDELRQGIRDIGNRIGVPVLEYAPDNIKLDQLKDMVDEVSRLVQRILGISKTDMENEARLRQHTIEGPEDKDPDWEKENN